MSELKKVGLTLSAEGAVEFKKTMTEVNASIQENRSQFNLAKSTWDDSTTASEKLRATSEYLTAQYEDSAEKVKILTMELAELEAAEGNNETAIAKKQAQLNNATASMNRYESGVEEVNAKIKLGTADLEEYAKKLQDVGDKTAEVGTAMSKNVTTPIVAVGTASVAAWKTVDDALDNIIAGTGATGDALDGLEESFYNVYGSFPGDSMDVSNAIADVNTRFGVTGEKLEDMSTAFLEYAKVNSTDVSSSIASVSRAMADANIDSSELGNVLDTLTTASQASGISVDTLTDSVTKYGAPMRTLGFDTEETIAMLASFEKAGVNSETAVAGMQKAVANWSKEGLDARTEFEKTIAAIENAESTTEASALAIEAFGTKAGPELADAIQSGRYSIDDMLSAMEGAEGTVTDCFEAMQSPTDEWKESMNKLTIAGADLGGELMTVLAPIIENVISSITSLTEWFKGLDDSTKETIVKIGLFVAAIGPVVIVVGKIVSFVGIFITVLTTLWGWISTACTAIGSMTAVMAVLTNPITWIIAGIVGLIAVFIALWNNCDAFRDGLINAFNTMKDGVLSFCSSVGTFFSDLWTGISTGFTTFIEGIKTAISTAIEIVSTIFNGFKDSITSVFEYIGDIIKSVWNGIVDAMNTAFSNISSAVSTIVSTVTDVFSSMVSGIGSIFSGLVSIVKTPINAVIGMINSLISACQSGINGIIKGLNKISFSIPDWVPAIGGNSFGVNLSSVSLSKIPYLAKGGTLLSGTALVGEAGPELLTQSGNRTTVAPLSRGGGANPVDIIDYDKMAQAMIKAMAYLKIELDDSEVGSFVDERILRAVT